MFNRRRVLVGSLGLVLGLTTLVAAQEFDLSWFTIDGGGGTSTGGGFELSGTIGQPDASVTPATGGGFELVGGFWPGAAPICLFDPDGDGIFELDDTARFDPCILGPGMASAATCSCFDRDGDNDVDLKDLAEALR